MLFKIALLLLTLTALVPGAFAQINIHIYSAAVIAGEGYTRGFHRGGALQWGRVYFGLDEHDLKLGKEREADFKALAEESGDHRQLDNTGVDFSFGAVASKSERFSIIPVALIGSTNTSLCGENWCQYSETVNYGAGLVATTDLPWRFGVHAGIRYTRNYGGSLMFGVVFNLD